jgi:two-component system, NarL family, competent response regulator ComA
LINCCSFHNQRHNEALVVDDHPLVASATKQLLNSIEGIEVIGIATTGKQCMAYMEEHEPKIVFLDYQLPDQLGTQVAREIKTNYPEVHIVIFTGADPIELMGHSKDLKISGYLSKEANARTITNMVNCILDNYTMLPLKIFHQIVFNNGIQSEDVLLEKEEVPLTVFFIGLPLLSWV